MNTEKERLQLVQFWLSHKIKITEAEPNDVHARIVAEILKQPAPIVALVIMDFATILPGNECMNFFARMSVEADMILQNNAGNETSV